MSNQFFRNSTQQYEKYKDSGIAWIGEIPEHWEVRRIKTLGKFWNGLTFSPENITNENNGVLVLRSSNIQNGKLVFNDNVYVSMQIPNEFFTQKGDIIICSRNGSQNLIGKNVLIENNEKYSFGVFLMIFRSIAPRFLYYILNSQIFTYYLGSFFTATINQLTCNNFGNMRIVYCPFTIEQEQIADYLDKKCALIDESIEKQKTSIEKLKEYKQAIITEAVTKGLNKSAPLKNSNIEWIGQIPEHWEKRKLYSLLSSIGSGTTPKEKSENGDILWLNTGDLNDSYINTTSKTITQEIYNNYSMLKLYKVSSIVIAMYGATIGKLGIINTPMTTNQACCVMQCSNQLYNKFLFYLLFSTRDFLISFSYGAGQPNINQEIIKNFKFFLPPLSEQEEIAAYLDKKCAEIDTAIQGKETLIEKLTEYKKSLIFECVTGKRKVFNGSFTPEP